MEIPFHSATHLRIWYSGPLRSLNPHFFLILVVAVISVIVLVIYQSRKNRIEVEEWADDYSQTVEDFQLEKERKETFLQNLAKLKQRSETGEIGEEDYKRLQETYTRRLKLVDHKLMKMQEILEQVDEEDED